MTLAPETAAKLIELAEEKHLYLGSAPDTFLGSALQTARKAIDDGLIGEVTSFEACANRDLDLLASIFRFLRMPGGGICYDFGVYYLTAIVSLFGPVDRVVSSVRNLAPKRVNVVPDSPEYGQEFDYSNESQAFTILEMKNGVTGTFCVNGDSTINDQAVFTIYGKKGILKLVDPNNFGGDIVYIPGVKDWTQQAVPEVLDYGFAYSENSRGLGPSEMAEAIAEGRLNRANAKMAYHVLDTIDQICLLYTSRDRRHAGAGCTRQNRKASLLPIQRGHVIRESGIQHAVGIHNNPGQDFFSNHHARESAGYGGEHRVCEIFKGDHAVGITEGF